MYNVLNKEVDEQVSHTEIAFKRCFLVKTCDASCNKKKWLSAYVWLSYLEIEL